MNTPQSTYDLKTRFNNHIIRQNKLNKKGFTNWAFYPGMLFGSTKKWWGDFGKRDTPHEGLDLCYFMNRGAKTSQLNENVIIPVMYDGVIVKIIDDYLGKTIITTHGFKDSKNQIFITIYGHTNPNKNLHAGQKVIAGDCIAALSDTRESPSGLPPHLHISAGWADEKHLYDQLDWPMISNSEIITLVDPMNIIMLKNEMVLLKDPPRSNNPKKAFNH